MNMSLGRAVLSATILVGGVVGAGGVIAQAANDGGDATQVPAGFQTVDDAATSNDSDTEGRGCNKGEAIAAALGLTTDELSAAREDGSSISEIAAAQGVDTDEVVAAIVDAKAERLEAKVASGDLTDAEAEERLASAEERAIDKVNGDS